MDIRMIVGSIAAYVIIAAYLLCVILMVRVECRDAKNSTPAKRAHVYNSLWTFISSGLILLSIVAMNLANDSVSIPAIGWITTQGNGVAGTLVAEGGLGLLVTLLRRKKLNSDIQAEQNTLYRRP